MTNNEEVEDSACNPRKAALVAVHLVSHVLNEAYVIANAAKDSGMVDLLIYLSSLKKLRTDNLDEFHYKDLTYTVSKEDNWYMYGNNENVLVTNSVATSTPQKNENNITKCMNETSYIGQGDEEFEVENHELRRTTSMFINNLFDMSDVEHVNLCDDTQNMQDDICLEISEINIDIKKIIDSYITSAVDIAFGDEKNEFDGNATSAFQSTENSSYSFLDDAFSTEIQKELAKYTENIQHNENIALESESTTLKDIECSYSEKKETFCENTILTCEDAYITLNRDYDQYSEDDEPILQDAKSTSLQEIELTTVDTPTRNVTPRQEKEKLVAGSGVTTLGTGSRKSNLVRRCRIQGARLLSCLRGWWWRRKRLGKRKEGRVCGSIRGLCPLSPDARRRASSLLDQRTLRTPSPSKSVVWKFNTLNEALVHSSHWKDFGYKMSLNENYEF